MSPPSWNSAIFAKLKLSHPRPLSVPFVSLPVLVSAVGSMSTVREALTVVWEASDRICGKRLKAALPSMVESLERYGHLDLDPSVRRRLFSASAATIDGLLRSIREQAGSRRKRKQKRKMAGRIPVRTFSDWKEPEPSYLEIDLVAHCGGTVTGSYISSLVVTDVCSGWTEAIPLLAREQTLVVEGLEAVSRIFRVPIRGINSDNGCVFINETLLGYCEDRGIEFTRSRAYRKNDQEWIEQKQPSLMSRSNSRRSPVNTSPCHGVEDGQKFMRTGSEGHLLRLSGVQHAPVELSQNRVIPAGY